MGNKSALFQVKAGHQTGDRPKPEPMMTQFDYTKNMASLAANELNQWWPNLQNISTA